MELKDTIDGMTSDDYKERFKAEYKQLIIRLEKLRAIINAYYANKLPFELSTPIFVLEAQRKYMDLYRSVLEFRATNEGINLD